MVKKAIYTLGLLGALGLSTQALSDTRASLFLAGEVELIANLFVNPTIGTTDLLDIVNGETGRQVATVDEESNNAAGYTISIESVNAGQLLHNDGTANTTYTISYDGGTNIAPGALGAPVIVKTSGILTGLTTDNSIVLIDVAPSALAIAGAYTDTLIFNMVAL